MFSELNGKVATVFEQRLVVRKEVVNGVTITVEKLVRVPIYPAEERSLCVVRNHRSSTTVNGVCLSCLQNERHIPKK